MRRSGGDRGSWTLEVAVLAPALLLLVFSVVQVGLWAFARSLALGAAQEGAEAGRRLGAAPRAAESHAEQFLARAAGDSLRSTDVRAQVTGTEVVVEVSGRALSVLPGVPGLPVRQAASAPRERFTAP